MIRKIRSFLFENTSTKQTIVKNTFWLLLAEFINKGSVFFITLFIANKLGAEQFGVMSFITSFVSVLIIFTDFGLTTLMVREVTKDQKKLSEYILSLSALKVILGIVTLFIAYLLTQLIPRFEAYTILILLYSTYAILSSFSDFLRASFRPSEAMQHEAYLKIFNGIIFTGGALYALLYFGDLMSIFYSYVIIGIVSFIVSIIYVGHLLVERRIVKVNIQLIKNSLFVGLILLLNSFFFQIYNISDQLMLGFYSMEIELGKYATAYQITAVLTLFFSIVISAINPQVIKNLSDKTRFLSFISRIKRMLIISVTTVSLITIVFSETLYHLLFSSEFADAYISLNILLLSLIFNILNIFTGNVLQNMNREKLCLWAVAFGGILNISLNFYFIKFGSIGVAITTFFTNIIVFIFLSTFFHYAQKDYWKTHQ